MSHHRLLNVTAGGKLGGNAEFGPTYGEVTEHSFESMLRSLKDHCDLGPKMRYACRLSSIIDLNMYLFYCNTFTFICYQKVSRCWIWFGKTKSAYLAVRGSEIVCGGGNHEK